MLKLFLSLYCTCFFCYVFYTRVPDYFDGEITTGIVNNTKVYYTANAKQYSITANYSLSKINNNQSVSVIYNPSKPQEAAIYKLWGYWFTWQELLMGIVLMLGLYKLASSITQNPTQSAIDAQQNVVDEPLKKYI